jgi:serine/threonine-protein kinase
MLIPGCLVGSRYRIRQVLGQGGMGTVYRAHDEQEGVEVAVKITDLRESGPSQREGAMEQFRREAYTLLALRHPNLPRFLDFLEDPDAAYLVMELIPGQNLAQVVHQQGPLPEAEVLCHLKVLASVLAYLHEQDPPIIFRDVKPSNVMVLPDGSIKLIDFGLVKSVEPWQGNLTQSSARGLVSPGFSAPEQYAGGTDPRSDLYALGATAYFLLTGQVPPESVERATSATCVPSPDTLNPEVSATTSNLVLKLLQLQRERRFPTARALLEEMEGRPAGLEPPTLPAGKAPVAEEAETRQVDWRSPARRRRHWWKPALVALALAGGWKLWSLLSAVSGAVLLQTDPSGAEILLDGVPIGTTPSKVTFKGSEDLVLRKDGYLDAAEVLRAADQEQSVFVLLRKAGMVEGADVKTKPGYYPPLVGYPSLMLVGAEQRSLDGFAYRLPPRDWSVVSESPEEVVLQNGDGRFGLGRTARLRTQEDQPIAVAVERFRAELAAKGWLMVRSQSEPERAVVYFERLEGAAQGRAGLVLLRARPGDRERLLSLLLESRPCPDVFVFLHDLDLLRVCLNLSP